MNTHANISRRDFLRGFGALLGAAPFCAASSDAAASVPPSPLRFDEHLAVLLSDLHVNGLDTHEGSKVKPDMRNWLKANVAEILRMDPLPRHVFVLGDIAYLQGRLADYQQSCPDLKLLVDAGINLVLTMGNHDHRKAFLEVWPEYAERTLVPDSIHTVTHCADYDVVMLDSLNEKDAPNAWNPVNGALSKAAQEWVLEELPKWPRPFFICAHHAIWQLKFGDGKKTMEHIIGTFPNCRGYINGHDHLWKTNIANWKNPATVPWLTLPSNGFWGDIGYVTLRTGQWRGRKGVQARLVQKDFVLNGGNPNPDPSYRPIMWETRMEDLKGAKCTFML